MERAKVGLVTTKMEHVTGVTIIQEQLCKYLKSLGYQAELLRPHVTPFRGIPGIGYPLSYALLHEQVREYDIILGNGLGLMGSLIAGVPCIDTIHSTPSGIDAALRKSLETIKSEDRDLVDYVLSSILGSGSDSIESELQHNQSAIRIDTVVAQRSESVVAVSNQTKQEVVAYFDVPENKIEVIPNGIDRMWFEGAKTPNESPVLVYTGRAGSNSKSIYLKGFDRLLTVLRAHREMPSKALIYNSSEEHAEPYLRLFRPYGTDVRLRLPQVQMRDQMHPGDIYICTSRYEAFGLSFVEAMARGLCVVSFPVGVAGELIQNGNTGYIVHSTDDMIAVIDSLKNNPELTRSVGRNASQAVLKTFSLDRMGSSYAQQIQRCIG